LRTVYTVCTVYIMRIAKTYRVGNGVVLCIPSDIRRGWKLAGGEHMVIEMTEPGRFTVRPLEVVPYGESERNPSSGGRTRRPD